MSTRKSPSKKSTLPAKDLKPKQNPKGGVDTFGDNSITLQMAMDRFSKSSQIMSNLLQKSSSTTAGIISNLK